MLPRHKRQRQLCAGATVVSHVSYADVADRCDLSGALGEGLFLSSDIHTHRTSTKQAHHHASRAAVCSQFPALTFCFGSFAFSQVAGDNSCSSKPNGDAAR